MFCAKWNLDSQIGVIMLCMYPNNPFIIIIIIIVCFQEILKCIWLTVLLDQKYKGKDYWELLTYGFPSLAHLKTIKIIGFMLYVQYFYDNKYPTCFVESLDGKMNLIRVLLKNATMLQKMIIHLPRKHRSRNIGVGAMGLWLKIKRLVSEKLTAIPGVSSSAQVLFSDY